MNNWRLRLFLHINWIWIIGKMYIMHLYDGINVYCIIQFHILETFIAVLLTSTVLGKSCIPESIDNAFQPISAHNCKNYINYWTAFKPNASHQSAKCRIRQTNNDLPRISVYEYIYTYGGQYVSSYLMRQEDKLLGIFQALCPAMETAHKNTSDREYTKECNASSLGVASRGIFDDSYHWPLMV